MSAKQVTKRKRLTAMPDKQTVVANELTAVEDKTALTRVKAEEKTKPKSKESLTEIQQTLRAAQAEVKRERQARIKAEKALAAARLEARQQQAPIRRVSFVVRLTVAEHGRLGRTEIEHVSSNRKQNFPTLDGEHLIAFMKACISAEVIPEVAISAAPSPEKVTTLKPVQLRSEFGLFVSEVQVFQGDPGFMTLILTPEKPFIVQAHFLVKGSEAYSLTSQESSYEIKVYAKAVTSVKSTLLTTYSAKLMQNVLEYSDQVKVHGLSFGLYRLFTVVTLYTPIKLGSFYGKTIIRVT